MENKKVMDKVVGLAEKFQSNRIVRAISGGMTGVMAIMLISSFATLIGAINFWGIGTFFENTGIKSILNQIVDMTNGIIAIYIAFVVAYKMGEIYESDALNCGIVGLMSFLILTPLVEISEGSMGIGLSDVGSGGVFVAMISSVVFGRLYIFLMDKKITIKMPDVVPPVVGNAFASIIPGAAAALGSGIVYEIMANTEYDSLSNFIYAILQKPLTALGSNIIAAMFIVAVIEFFWFFGIHGVMVVMPILMAIFYGPQVANMEAYNAGKALPYLFTYGFILNNRGARSFAVALHCIFNCKSEQLKAVGKAGLVPSLFGISEPIKFGIPQVMNIRMLVPLMLTPAVSVFSAWLLTVIGFLPYHNGVTLPLGFPIIVNGFFMNGWQGIVAQLVQVVLCYIIYIPFMRWEDKAHVAEEEENRRMMESEAVTE